jgi:uncharacterized membrane protein (DUF2068 family)
MRPTGVTILAVLCYLGAACSILVGLAMFLGMGAIGAMMEASMPGATAMMGAIGAGLGIVIMLFGVLYFFVGWGLWTLKNWARIVALVLTFISLGLTVLGLFGSLITFEPVSLFFNLVFVGIYGLIAWYLMQAHVKQAFAA